MVETYKASEAQRARREHMDKEFTHNGAILMAVSAGFKENGCDVYEVQTIN